MTEFKVGDWIRYINGKTTDVSKVMVIGFVDNHVEIMTGENIHVEDCWLWEPKQNEWVIPINYNTAFNQYFEVVMYDEADPVNCEPFIGRLPSWMIKEKNEQF
jgi:hypothetical protein